MSEPQEFIDTPPGEVALGNNELATEHIPSVGAQLAHRREQHGWSIDDVANQLKLAPRQIHAIETDNYAALPTIVMTRGYIRSYAKMLGLDPATILPSAVPVSAARIHASEARSRSTIFAESRLLLSGRNRVPYKGIFGVILCVVVLIIVAQLGGFSALRQPSADIGSPHVAPETGSDALKASSASARSVASSDASNTVLATNSVGESAIANPQPAPVEATVATAGANKLTLDFKQNSWVEIKRADKSTLFSRVGKAGTTETFDIDQPVSVVIGNLSGVDVTFRGAPLDLKAGTKNNIARLNLK